MERTRCVAKARTSGEQCKRVAIEGGTVCRSHGGAAPNVKAAAARRVAEARAAEEMRLLAAPVDISPGDALIELVQWTAGEVRYWRAEVSLLAEADPDALTWGRTRHEDGIGPEGPIDKTTTEAVPHVAYRMLTDAQDRLARYAAAALRAGVEERRVRLAEDQGALVAQVIRAILDDLHLTADQASRVPEVVPHHLRLLAQST